MDKTSVIEEAREILAVELPEVGNLPALTGSEKQIDWATGIRARWLHEPLRDLADDIMLLQEDMRDYENGKTEEALNEVKYDVEKFNKDSEKYMPFITWAKVIDSSRFWIDTRDYSTKLMHRHMKDYIAARDDEAHGEEVGFQEVRVPYSAYKERLEWYRTVPNSYDSIDKTIALMISSDNTSVSTVLKDIQEAREKEKRAREEAYRKKEEERLAKEKEEAPRRIRIKYRDLKGGIFYSMISHTVGESYDDCDHTIAVIAKTDEDRKKIEAYYEGRKKQDKRCELKRQLKKGLLDEIVLVPDVIDPDTISDEIPEELANG